MKNSEQIRIEEIQNWIEDISKHVDRIRQLTYELHLGNLSDDSYYKDKEYTKLEASFLREECSAIRSDIIRLTDPSTETKEFKNSVLCFVYATENILIHLNKREMRTFQAGKAFHTHEKFKEKAVIATLSILAKSKSKEEPPVPLSDKKTENTKDCGMKHPFFPAQPHDIVVQPHDTPIVKVDPATKNEITWETLLETPILDENLTFLKKEPRAAQKIPGVKPPRKKRSAKLPPVSSRVVEEVDEKISKPQKTFSYSTTSTILNTDLFEEEV